MSDDACAECLGWEKEADRLVDQIEKLEKELFDAVERRDTCEKALADIRNSLMGAGV